MRIITFITNKAYERMANRLIRSGEKFGYKIKLIRTKTIECNSWSQAILKKVEIINEYYSNDQPLLYLDADCEIVKQLDDFFHVINFNNLSIRHRVEHLNPYQCGVMGFSSGMNRFLLNWLKRTRKEFGKHKTVDQEILADLIAGPFSKISIYNIGHVYNFTNHDALQYDISEAKILHHKASKTNDYARNWFKKWARDRQLKDDATH